MWGPRAEVAPQGFQRPPQRVVCLAVSGESSGRTHGELSWDSLILGLPGEEEREDLCIELSLVAIEVTGENVNT